jgi:hypothetical protein
MRGSSKAIRTGLLILGLGFPFFLHGQLPEPGSAPSNAPNPLSDPTVKPGKMLLFDLEARFA